MVDGKPKDATVPEGKKPDKPVKDDKKDISELDKLKAYNKDLKEELAIGKELRAEAQKLEAEKLMSGDAGGNVEVKKEDPDQEMADKLLADSE